MTPEQFTQLLSLLKELASKTYTITGAADWPILAIVGGGLVSVIAFMWVDLRSVIKDNRSEWRQELEKQKSDNDKAHDLLWDAHRDCQHECCPRRKE